jgi:hypothetical protein
VQARPVRMLVAVANPDGLAMLGLIPIDVDKEWQLVKELVSHPGMELELLPQPCTLSALADKLAEGFHILHLVCHGSFANELGIAALYLADGNNQVVRVHDHEIVAALRNRLPAVPEKERLRLIFLASCETATRSPADAFRGLAPQLVNAGVPVVLAMQDKVPVRTAQAFAGTFYEKLLQHGLVDLASNQARDHVIAERLPGSSIPVLFMRLDDGRLWDTSSSSGRPTRQVRNRRIDAAAPSAAEVGRPIDVLVQVRFLDSPVLGADAWSARRRPEEIVQESEAVALKFAVDPSTGTLRPATLELRIVAPTFEVAGSSYVHVPLYHQTVFHRWSGSRSHP